MAKVTMPQLGESVAEGTIGKWLKQPGDHVDKYEPLVEVVTDKVNAEVPSPFEGILREILVEEGVTVPNNAEIAVIETADDATSTAPAEAPTPAAATGPAGSDESPAAATPEPPAEAAAAPEPEAAPAAADRGRAPRRPQPPRRLRRRAPVAAAPAKPSAGADPDARMTPAVRRLLREHELEPAQIVGTGGGGRITRDDVLLVVEAMRTGSRSPRPRPRRRRPGHRPQPAPGAGSAPAAAPPSPQPAAASGGAGITFPDGADEVLVPMTQMRKGIAAQMTRALAVPHAYVHMEVDATTLVRARTTAKREYQAREGISLSYVPFVIKAAVEALRGSPSFNAHWTDDGLLAKRRIHMGVAVAVDDGLLVPVVRDVDQLSISGLNRAIADVAARARAGKLRLEDYGGSTFTIDNTGWFGSNLTMPIINVPEVAILTMEAITKRAVVVETPGRRRDRHPAGHEHGPGDRPPSQRRRPGGRVPARDQGLARGCRAGHADLLIWHATFRCSARPTRVRITVTCPRSRWAGVSRANRPAMARPRCAAIRTGSGLACRPATTTTNSRD